MSRIFIAAVTFFHRVAGVFQYFRMNAIDSGA